MNIKEHIEAGHYPVDEKGRALVPHSEGGHVLVLATDFEGKFPIVGARFRDTCLESITRWMANVECLLPPPPRKVKVTQFAVMVFGFARPWFVRDTEFQARNDAGDRLAGDRWTVVEITGEYEEPWS